MRHLQRRLLMTNLLLLLFLLHVVNNHKERLVITSLVGRKCIGGGRQVVERHGELGYLVIVVIIV